MLKKHCMAAQDSYMWLVKFDSCDVNVLITDLNCQASDLTFEPNAEKIINGTVEHTLSIIKAAANIPTIKSFVLTSSASACSLPAPNQKDIVINESEFNNLPGKKALVQSHANTKNYPDTWNDASVAAAWNGRTPNHELPLNIYAAAKTEGERAAWRYHKDNKLPFVLNTILPAVTVSSDRSLLFLRDSFSCNADSSACDAVWDNSGPADRGQHHGCCS